MSKRERKQPRDAATFGDARQPETTRKTSGEHPGNATPPAGVRPCPPGERDDLSADNSQGFTREIGDRKRQFPGSEAARRTVPGSDEPSREEVSAENIERQRRTSEMSPDDLDTQETID